jgi:hypothetical protein
LGIVTGGTPALRDQRKCKRSQMSNATDGAPL